MTRRSVRLILLHSVSHGAQDYLLAPPAYAFTLDMRYERSAEISATRFTGTARAHLNFIDRVRLWLRLLFGAGQYSSEHGRASWMHTSPSSHQLRYYAHRSKRNKLSRKHPAHELEMLMQFAPGCLRGLTLNQYRERLTRLSALGRFQIYCYYFRPRHMRLKASRKRTIMRTFGQTAFGLCPAPLKPD